MIKAVLAQETGRYKVASCTDEKFFYQIELKEALYCFDYFNVVFWSSEKVLSQERGILTLRDVTRTCGQKVCVKHGALPTRGAPTSHVPRAQGPAGHLGS